MSAATKRRPGPGLKVERSYWDTGREIVVGIDEVGKGSWAGPLTLAAVVLPPDRRVYGVRDSKQLTERRREELYDRVLEWCAYVAVGHASAAECDELGMSDAQRLAVRRALDGLGVHPDVVVMDGQWDFAKGVVDASVERRTVVKGDATCLSIAAASVVAKVTRDRMMRADAESFPAFNFDRNKGYPCPRHQAALQGYGPTSIHRRSWVFMEQLAWRGALRLVPATAQPALF